MKLKNVSPYGDLDVPLLRSLVPAGAQVDVSEDQARRLLPQAENWQPADDEAKAVLADLTKPADEQAEAKPAPTKKK